MLHSPITMYVHVHGYQVVHVWEIGDGSIVSSNNLDLVAMLNK